MIARVVKQGLERPEPEGFVEHLADQPVALADAHQLGALAGHLLGHPANLAPQFVLAHAAQCREIHGGNELRMKFLLLPREHIITR